MLPAVGAAMLLIPTFVTTCWIVAFAQGDDHGDRVAQFNAMVPHMLRRPGVGLLFALGGAAVGATGLIRLAGFPRLLCAALFGVGGLLSTWFVWTLL